MAPQVLLAKRPRKPGEVADAETLRGHSLEVFHSAEVILSMIGEQALWAVDLPPFYVDELRAAVLRAAVIHDLGKANADFQQMVTAGLETPQSLRHEWVTAWILADNPALSEWLFADQSVRVRMATTASVLGHHLKAKPDVGAEPQKGSTGVALRVYLGHRDVSALLAETARVLGLQSPPQMSDREVALCSASGCLPSLVDWVDRAFESHEAADDQHRTFVALVKAITIAADVVGSALPKRNIEPTAWLHEVLSRSCSREDLESVVASRLDGSELRPFQELVRDSHARVTLVTAGCGTGKTAAAYAWGSLRAQGKKLYFAYPTTGTATEGYRDYVLDSVVESALVHSRAECDLQDILDAGEAEPSGGVSEASQRLEALQAWDAQVIVCTVDSVLGLLQNNRKPLFSFPALARAAFVFDEIHLYDGRLYEELLRFLQVFRGADVLLMTASLPADRRKALQRVVPDLEVVPGPESLETIPRYELHPLQNSEPWDEVDTALRQGRRVLWVANTVNRCAQIASEAEKRGHAPEPYHSRYRYLDRQKHHNKVMHGFRAETPFLAVTTQVCEVSLDISADLLVSELAPIPALIQRLGRLNRRNPVRPMPAVFVESRHPAPYDPGDLELARQWLGVLCGRPVSQRDLAGAFEELAIDEHRETPVFTWLDGGPCSVPGATREGDASVQIVRAEDRAFCLERGRPASRLVTKYAIPMLLRPVANEIRNWTRMGTAFVAPHGKVKYDERWGAEWRK